jgi:hypothetical protein
MTEVRIQRTESIAASPLSGPLEAEPSVEVAGDASRLAYALPLVWPWVASGSPDYRESVLYRESSIGKCRTQVASCEELAACSRVLQPDRELQSGPI